MENRKFKEEREKKLNKKLWVRKEQNKVIKNMSSIHKKRLLINMRTLYKNALDNNIL